MPGGCCSSRFLPQVHQQHVNSKTIIASTYSQTCQRYPNGSRRRRYHARAAITCRHGRHRLRRLFFHRTSAIRAIYTKSRSCMAGPWCIKVNPPPPPPPPRVVPCNIIAHWVISALSTSSRSSPTFTHTVILFTHALPPPLSATQDDDNNNK